MVYDKGRNTEIKHKLQSNSGVVHTQGTAQDERSKNRTNARQILQRVAVADQESEKSRFGPIGDEQCSIHDAKFRTTT